MVKGRPLSRFVGMTNALPQLDISGDETRAVAFNRRPFNLKPSGVVVEFRNPDVD